MISIIFDGVKTIVGWLAEKSKARHERDMAQLQLEKRLLLSEQEANSKWEIAQLNDKDKILRYCAFVLFASPLIASLISPNWGHKVQLAWQMMKPWQANVLCGMCCAVFGMRKVPNIIGSIVGSIKEGLKK